MTLVAAGLCVAIVPAATAALDIAGVSYRPLVPVALGIDLIVGYAVEARSPLIDRVLAVIRQLTSATDATSH